MIETQSKKLNAFLKANPIVVENIFIQNKDDNSITLDMEAMILKFKKELIDTVDLIKSVDKIK